MPEVQGIVGQQNVQVGAKPTQSYGRQGESLVSELHGRYTRQTADGNLFHAASGSITVAAANVSPLAAGTGQPIIGLWNPLNSGKNIAILKVGASTVSGTPGGPLLWNFALNQIITAVANGVVMSGNLSQAAAAVAKIFNNIALTGGTVQTYLSDAANISAVAAAAITSALKEDLGGTIIVPPGGFLSLAALAAGTAHIVRASLEWEEFVV